MKFLHTSDWHLGRRLHNQQRSDEMRKFLVWLSDLIREREIDVLLLSGDVFDNTTPSTDILKMYYDFLERTQYSNCQTVVIGGNHDSAALLDAPSRLCRVLDIHVIGSAWRYRPEHEVITLKNPKSGCPGAIVCAVPFLRNSDVRNDLGETDTRERQEALLNGIRAHYEAVIKCARQRQYEIHKHENITVPIILMGHLFARGGKIIEGDGVRELYVGNLNPCDLDMFPTDICYTALGHIHVPQLVRGAGPNGLGTIRYSGTPIPMGFNEADQKKSVCLITCPDNMAMASAMAEKPVNIEMIDIPTYQTLVSVRGDWDEIKTRIKELATEVESAKANGQEIWLGVTYTGQDATLDIVGELSNYLGQDSGFEVLSTRSDARVRSVETRFKAVDGAGLDALTPEQVFERYLLEHGLGEPSTKDSSEKNSEELEIIKKRESLIETYREAVAEVQAGNML